MRNTAEFFLVVRHAAARAAERERGTDDDGIADLIRDRKTFFNCVRDIRGNAGLADLLHGLFEQFPVLGAVDRVHFRSDEFDAPLVQKAFLRQLTADGQSRLSAQ